MNYRQITHTTLMFDDGTVLDFDSPVHAIKWTVSLPACYNDSNPILNPHRTVSVNMDMIMDYEALMKLERLFNLPHAK